MSTGKNAGRKPRQNKDSKKSASNPTDDAVNEATPTTPDASVDPQPVEAPPDERKLITNANDTTAEAINTFMSKFGKGAARGSLISTAPAQKTRTFSISLPSFGIPYQKDKYNFAYPDGQMALHPLRLRVRPSRR